MCVLCRVRLSALWYISFVHNNAYTQKFLRKLNAHCALLCVQPFIFIFIYLVISLVLFLFDATISGEIKIFEINAFFNYNSVTVSIGNRQGVGIYSL